MQGDALNGEYHVGCAGWLLIILVIAVSIVVVAMVLYYLKIEIPEFLLVYLLK